ncbi:MAG: ascorbate-dependent monooxygenase [Acidobacteria bacterium]|nr:MAG: ascorbate-dependent monooxygenase [Acidobacteriota bacterium]
MRRIAFVSALVLAFVSARQRAIHPAPPPVGPTFSKEVSRIFQANCQTCHHPGDIGPFSLMTYADAYPHASDIKYMTQTHQMPPWKPAQSCGIFDSPRILSQPDIDTLAKWAGNGAPEGNRADLPPALDFTGGWALGQPDLVLSNSQPYTPPALGDMYRCYSMPANTTDQKYVSAIDIKPGDRQTVHHVIAFIDTTGASDRLVGSDGGAGYPCFGGPGFTITNLDATTLGGWAPGYRPVMLPDGIAFSLPANSRIVLQVHYHPHGTVPLPDQTQIGIYYAKKAPTKLMRVLPLINDTFMIPPNDPNYRVTADFTLPSFPPINTHVWLIAPHMHLLGRQMHVTAASVTGQNQQCLIAIDDWDFNWQGMYRFKDPIAVPAGTKLSLEAFYDNSTGNWRNPNDPPKPVSWGEATTDEMCIAFLGFTIDSENLATGQVVDTSWIPRVPQ